MFGLEFRKAWLHEQRKLGLAEFAGVDTLPVANLILRSMPQWSTFHKPVLLLPLFWGLGHEQKWINLLPLVRGTKYAFLFLSVTTTVASRARPR